MDSAKKCRVIACLLNYLRKWRLPKNTLPIPLLHNAQLRCIPKHMQNVAVRTRQFSMSIVADKVNKCREPAAGGLFESLIIESCHLAVIRRVKWHDGNLFSFPQSCHNFMKAKQIMST